LSEKEIQGTWQYAGLRSFFENHARDEDFNSRTVFLTNPKEKQFLDEIIHKYLWPGVLKGVSTSGIWIKALEGTFPRSGIEDEMHQHTTRTLTFLLEDPRRQISFGSDVPWFCRGKIQCSVLDYMISFDLYVYLPEAFSFKKIIRLLKNSEFSGLPPELSFNKSIYGKGIFCLAFTTGNGAGWDLHSYQEASSKVKDAIIQNIEVIRAIYALEQDYKSTKNFNKFELALIAAFGSK